MSGSTAASFYVATSGSDTAGDGSLAKPFATLARAQSAMLASSSIKTTTIEAGTYRLTSTLTLGSADSGETWQAATGAKVVIDGGQVITGFTAQGNGIYSAHTAPVSVDLSLGGVRAMAADAGYDPAQPFTSGWSISDPNQIAGLADTSFIAKAADLTPALTPGATIQLIDGLRYNDETTTVVSVDPATRLVTLANPIVNGTGPGVSWRVLGAPSDLTLDNTFAYDRTSQSLLVKTSNSSVLNGGVEAARLDKLISGNGANNVTIEGLTFENTTSYNGDIYGNDAAISLQFSQGDTLTGNSFTNVGNGVSFITVGGSTVSGNSFFSVGGTGVAVDRNSDNDLVSNNTLVNLGATDAGTPGISVINGTNDTVTGNYIDGTPRWGIFLFYTETATGDVVSNNTVLHTSQQTNDASPIGAYGGSAAGYQHAGLTVTDNRVESTGGLARAADGSYTAGDAYGIGLDDHVSDVTVTGNVVEGAYDRGLSTHGGENVAFNDNIVILRPSLTFTDASGTRVANYATVAGHFDLQLLPGDIDPSKPSSDIVLTASSAPDGGGHYAHVRVLADGTQIGQATLTGNLANYEFSSPLTSHKTHVISFVFDNGSTGNTQGPPLYIQSVDVNGSLYGSNSSGGVQLTNDDLETSHIGIQDNIIYSYVPNVAWATIYAPPGYVDPNPATIDGNDLYNIGGQDIQGEIFTNPLNVHSTNADPMFVDKSIGDYRLQSGSPAAALGFSQTGVPLVAPTVPCFALGTRILTADGERAVETLEVGDRVACAFVGEAAVIWIGRRRIDCARHSHPRSVWPVRVRAGAFGATPTRDLFLSPDHALFVDGALIPVRHLIDGDAIAQVRRRAVTYLHVELARHDVILAEGLPAESYLDTGHRAALGDGRVIALHPDFASRTHDAAACAPLAVAGPAVERVRARLAQRIAGADSIEADVVTDRPLQKFGKARRR